MSFPRASAWAPPTTGQVLLSTLQQLRKLRSIRVKAEKGMYLIPSPYPDNLIYSPSPF